MVSCVVCACAVSFVDHDGWVVRFGKGMMPKAYRLSVTSMAIIMDNYAR